MIYPINCVIIITVIIIIINNIKDSVYGAVILAVPRELSLLSY